MSEALGTSRAGADGAWPWEQSVTGARRLRAARRRLSEAWSLSAVTTVLLAVGYGWLGSVAGGRSGALLGAVVGLALSALLRAVVDRAVSGANGRRTAGRRHPGRCRRHPQ
ncbi:hypothetical protein [Streptomyces sp. NPDC002328]|uniref:hypothetical protein n=1 Tax=Streptomyces sp. NPDC002328 TaxID=3364642 RepID=UPI003697F0DA